MMICSFQKRYQALLLASQMIGILERMIKRRIMEASSDELFSLDRELWKRARELAKPENAKVISLGRLRNEYFGHPFYKILSDEAIRRDRLNTPPDPRTGEEIRAYLISRAERHGSTSFNNPKKDLPVLPPRRKIDASK